MGINAIVFIPLLQNISKKMADNTIKIIEKEDPPRIKEEYSTLTIKIRPHNPDVKMSEQVKRGASLKLQKPLVEEIEGPYDWGGNYVEELEIGKVYTYKATKFKKSTFTLIKHIWWAEQLDDGEIVDLPYNKGENPYLNDEGIVCYDYEAKECTKVRIYAYVASPDKKVSIESFIAQTKVISFFIGGAGDKESYYGKGPSLIMEKLRGYLSKSIDEGLKKYCKNYHLGYNEARGDKDIERKIISKIPNKDKAAINIIGHSLGGWNGAHLSKILTDKGYNVDLLITLEPVGTGSMVTYASDIFWTTPKPKANYWINIFTNPDDYQQNDFIADVGGQWLPREGTQIYDECNCNHFDADEMIKMTLKDTNISALDMLLHHIKLFISKTK